MMATVFQNEVHYPVLKDSFFLRDVRDLHLTPISIYIYIFMCYISVLLKHQADAEAHCDLTKPEAGARGRWAGDGSRARVSAPLVFGVLGDFSFSLLCSQHFFQCSDHPLITTASFFWLVSWKTGSQTSDGSTTQKYSDTV